MPTLEKYVCVETVSFTSCKKAGKWCRKTMKNMWASLVPRRLYCCKRGDKLSNSVTESDQKATSFGEIHSQQNTHTSMYLYAPYIIIQLYLQCILFS